MRRPGTPPTGGYTLTEILVVITIMGMLAGLLFPVFSEARREAKVSECHHNMQQIYKGLMMWDMDHDRYRENYVDRVTNLQEEKYIGGKEVFICPLDRNGGKQGPYPDNTKDGANKFSDNDEKLGGPGMDYCSYMYEFSGATCRDQSYWQGELVFPDGVADQKVAVNSNYDDSAEMRAGLENSNWSWGEVKAWQLEYGDAYLTAYRSDMEWDWMDGDPCSYDRHWFPLLRCFWHENVDYINTAGDDLQRNLRGRISNVNMDGGLLLTGPKWEVVAAYHMFSEKDDTGDDPDDWDDPDFGD